MNVKFIAGMVDAIKNISHKLKALKLTDKYDHSLETLTNIRASLLLISKTLFAPLIFFCYSGLIFRFNKLDQLD